MTTYLVKEIFGPTLQGEGTYTGVPVFFVRMAKCNKWTGDAATKPASICNYCDTDFVGGVRMSPEEIEEALENLMPASQRRNPRVVISGGEPALQPLRELCQALKASCWEIHLETNGSLALNDAAQLIDHITCSPKQPRSETKLEYCDDLKILWPPIHPEITPEAFADFPHETLYLQPVHRGEDASTAANVATTVAKVIELDCHLSLQTHKITGVQ